MLNDIMTFVNSFEVWLMLGNIDQTFLIVY